jgi:eukaryotic-like serine/threonine-protein kinase
MSIAPGMRLGRYEVVATIGAGGMGEVYRARDPRLGRDVAIKVLAQNVAQDPVLLERFIREARAVAALNHPHIVTIYSTEEADGVPFLTMELVEGRTLDALLRPGGMPIADLLEIAIPLADALSAAHAKRITHRDLKPSNVMVTGEGRVKVLDFGLARIADAERTSTDAAATQPLLTQKGTIVGTMPYMSPEQIAGEEVDHRSDLFSLGVLLYEMASGVRPFHGASSPLLMSSILRDTPPDLRDVRGDVPEAFARLVGRLLEKRRNERVQTARDVYAALRDVQKAPGVDTVPQASAAQAPSGQTAGRGVVVLPFANVGGDAADEYLSDGLTEEVIGDLSRVGSLRVISRSSSLRLKGTTKDVFTIARELGVSHVLEGSVRKAGPQLRISVQLVDALSDTQVWSEKFAGPMDDVFELQERVSREIARALNVRLTPAQAQRLAGGRIHDVRVLEISMRARHEIRRATPEAVARGIAMLDEGERVAPGDVALKSLRIYAQVVLFKMGVPMTPEAVAVVEAQAREVFALAPDSLVGHFTLGYLAFERGDQQAAVVHLKRAVEIQPDPDALTFLAVAYLYAGRLDAARPVIRRLLAVDPLTAIGWLSESVAEWFAGRFAEGVPAVERAIALEPGSPLVRWHRAYLMLLAGREEDAAADVAWMQQADPASPYSRQIAAMSAALGGDQVSARAALAPLEAIDFDHHLSFHIGEAEALAGNTGRALRLMERSVRHGFFPYEFIAKHNPFLASLRGDPRFEAIVEEARARWMAFEE